MVGTCRWSADHLLTTFYGAASSWLPYYCMVQSQKENLPFDQLSYSPYSTSYMYSTCIDHCMVNYIERRRLTLISCPVLHITLYIKLSLAKHWKEKLDFDQLSCSPYYTIHKAFTGQKLKEEAWSKQDTSCHVHILAITNHRSMNCRSTHSPIKTYLICWIVALFIGSTCSIVVSKLPVSADRWGGMWKTPPGE